MCLLVVIYWLYDRDGDKMAPNVEKKIAELEMGLLHLQQNIDIPEISLVVHPTVAQIVKKYLEEEGRKANVNDFGDKASFAQQNFNISFVFQQRQYNWYCEPVTITYQLFVKVFGF